MGRDNKGEGTPNRMTDPTRSPRTRRFVRVGLLVYAVAWLFCLLPFLMKGVLPGHWTDDTNLCFIPYRAYLLRMIHHLNFPDLAAGEFLGQPMMTYGQPMLLYPTMVLGWLVPLPQGAFFLLDLWIHAVLAALGCAWLLRKRGASTMTALALGWVYPNTTAFLFRAYGHWTMVHQAALLPWVLLAWEELDRVRRGKVWRPSAAFAIVIALLLMGRTPHWPYLLVVSLTPLEVWRAIRRRRLISIPRRVGVFALIGIGALVLAAPDVFPPLLGVKDSYRAVLHGTDFSRLWTLSPINLLTLVSPYGFFGGRPETFYLNWWPTESAVIVGRGVLILGLVGLVTVLARPKRLLGRGGLPVVLIVVGLLFGMGSDFDWLWKGLSSLPLYTSIRAWGRASILIVLGLLLLAGPAIDGMASRGRKSRVAAGTAVVVCVLLALFTFWVRGRLGGSPGRAMHFLTGLGWQVNQFHGRPKAFISALESIRGHLGLDGLAYALCAVLAAGFLLLRSSRSRLNLKEVILFTIVLEAVLFQQFVWTPRARPLTPDTMPNGVRALEELRDKARPAPITVAFIPHQLSNFGLEFEGVRSISGTDSNMRKEYAQWLYDVEKVPHKNRQLESKIKGFPKALLDVTGLTAGVHFGDHTGTTDPTDVPYSCLVIPSPIQTPYVELVNADGNKEAEGKVTVTAWDEDTVNLKVQAPKGATVRVREFPDPQWHVTVNGRTTDPEWEHHNLFIPIPAGEAEVHLEYIDLPARVSVAVSLLGWLALAVVWGFLRLRKARRR